MTSRTVRAKFQVSSLEQQVESQQAVVVRHEQSIQSGDASPKRAHALAVAQRRLEELQARLRAA